jgi:hypothetical protein
MPDSVEAPIVDAAPTETTATTPPATPPDPSDAISMIDKMNDAPPAEDPKPAPAKSAAPAKAVKAEPAKAVPAKATKAAEKSEIQILEDTSKVAPPALRKAYEELKAKHKLINEELQKARTKPPVQDDPEKVTMRETLAQREKRLAEVEDHIRFIDYEKSSEYKEKYHDPYLRTAENATREVQELRVPLADGTVRAATAEDFWSIVHIPNAEDALAAAEKLFGSPSKATFVMEKRGEIRRAWAAGEQAKAEYRKTGIEREKTTQAERERASRESTEKWKTLNEKTVEENPELYGSEEGDEEGNALLATGFERADAAFGGQITDLETGKKRPPTADEMIQINSELRNKAAGFDRLAHRNTKLAARIAELEAQVAEYEKSGPSGGEPEGGTKVEVDSFDAALAKITG